MLSALSDCARCDMHACDASWMRGLVKTGPRTQCLTETGFFFKKMFRTKTRSDWEVMDQLLGGFVHTAGRVNISSYLISSLLSVLFRQGLNSSSLLFIQSFILFHIHLFFLKKCLTTWSCLPCFCAGITRIESWLLASL